MPLLYCAYCILFLAAFPALLFLWNLLLYRKPPVAIDHPSVSILIPARNEERSIGDCVTAALASRQVDLEVIVLDDHSDDRTAEIVQQLAVTDTRLRLVPAPTLPPGWCGKQFACSALAGLATKPILCFLDADVRLSQDGVAGMIGALRLRKSGLVSGFPRQVTHSALEQLLLPLMHFLLLGFLPLFGMRRCLSPAFGAGCGQIFVAERDSYQRAGGHASIRHSRHDGITLPKAFRRAGVMTDLCDATDVAACRMYHNAREVFLGLLKNASEGLASPARIIPFSAILFFGQVLPFPLLAFVCTGVAPHGIRTLLTLSVFAAYLPRLIAAFRFRQPLLAAFFHPLAILVLLGIQWYALLRSVFHLPATWKGRSYSTNKA